MWKDAVGGDEVSFKLRALVPRSFRSEGVVSERIISSPAWYVLRSMIFVPSGIPVCLLDDVMLVNWRLLMFSSVIQVQFGYKPFFFHCFFIWINIRCGLAREVLGDGVVGFSEERWFRMGFNAGHRPWNNLWVCEVQTSVMTLLVWSQDVLIESIELPLFGDVSWIS